MRTMIRVTFLALASVALFTATGCARKYDMKLSSGVTITTFSKPKLTPQGDYVYKNRAGQMESIPAGRVREIDAR